MVLQAVNLPGGPIYSPAVAIEGLPVRPSTVWLGPQLWCKRPSSISVGWGRRDGVVGCFVAHAASRSRSLSSLDQDANGYGAGFIGILWIE